MEKSQRQSKPITPFLFLIIVSCLCTLIYLYALPYGITSLMELSNRGLLIMWIIGGGYVLIRQLLKAAPKIVVITVALVACSLAALLVAVLGSTGDLFNKTMSVLGFLVFPIMICYSALFRIDERAKRAVCLFAFLCSLVFIRLYFSNLRHQYMGPYGYVQLDEITLGYPNPNQTAIFLFACAVTLFAAQFYFRSRTLQMLFALDGCFMAWMLFQTESRTAILLIVAFLFLAFVLRKREIPKVLNDIALLMPLLYIGAYLVLSFLQQHVSILSVDMFNGREKLFAQYFDGLGIMTALFGNLNTYQFSNLHNGYIAIAASAGLPCCLCYFLCLKSCVMKNRVACSDSAPARTAFIAFLCMIMYTSSEAAFLVGGSVYGFLLFAPVVLFATPYVRMPQG